MSKKILTYGPETKAQEIQIPLEIKAVSESGEFEGYGSVWDILDSHEDRVLRGAFKQTLEEWANMNRLPSMLWSHDVYEPIGYYKEMREDEIGLYVKGQLLVDDIPRARQVRALMKHKAIGGLSIGYVAREVRFDEQTFERDLVRVDLKEVSPVTFPSNTAAMVVNVKAFGGQDLPTEREFERALRDSGLSKSQALTVVSKGYRHMLTQARDSQSTDNELKALGESLKAFNDSLRNEV